MSSLRIQKKNNIGENRRKLIDMITGFYVFLIGDGGNTNPDEINTLYSLLENLFADENISWEEQIRTIAEKETKINEIINYLNKHLITLDKIRLILNLIVLANADNVFTTREVTIVLNLVKKLNINPEGILDLISAVENKNTELVGVANFRYLGQVNRAIFRDYLLFGTGSDCQIRLSNSKIAANEILLMVIERYFFIGTGNTSNSFINDNKLLPNRLYCLPPNGTLTIGSQTYKQSNLSKMFDNRNIYDVMALKKKDYDFKIINNRNRYSIIIYEGHITKNEKLLSRNKEHFINFDDIMQIRDYDSFTLLNVMEDRDIIGVDVLNPLSLYINYDNHHLILTQEETPQTILTLDTKREELEGGKKSSRFSITNVKKGWDIYLNNQPVKVNTPFLINRDILSVNKSQADTKFRFLISSFYDLVMVPFEIEQLTVSDLKHYFKDGEQALDGISFEAGKGEIVAVMGRSGCGKSTLLKAISGELFPNYGRVFINRDSYYENIDFYSQYIGYVPQEDLLFPHLTVFENLYYRGRLLLSDIPASVLTVKVNNILTQTNLYHRRDVLVGELNDSILSGGERKRLNISLELLTDPSLLICDEPTTGLSSNDSEQIIDLLKAFSEQGKIIILTIHQPGPQIYEQFNKVLVMDMGGKCVFFGRGEEIFSYFDNEVNQIEYRKEEILKKRDLQLPEYFQELIDYPVYNKKNEKVYEQIGQMLIVKRKFPPSYWKDKFKRRHLLEMISFKRQNEEDTPFQKEIPVKRVTHLSQILTFLKRNVLMKFRNKTNMAITFIQAPLLAAIISFILRSAQNGEAYNYYQNDNIPVFFFVSIIVFIFLGLSNSIEDIMGEKKIILREKTLRLKISYFFAAKLISLSLFTLIQVLLYYFVSISILKITGILFITIFYFFVSGVIGYSIGLLLSSFINDRRSIINVLPLILIPQIIFGGAIILYENMNPSLTLRKSSTIPEVVAFIPSRWLFEGAVTGEARLNNYYYYQRRVEKKRLTLVGDFRDSMVSEDDYQSNLNKIYDEKSYFAKKYPRAKYSNRSTSLVVDLMDGRVLNTGKSAFMASLRMIRGKTYPVYYLNLIVLTGYFLLFNLITLLRLKYFYKERYGR